MKRNSFSRWIASGVAALGVLGLAAVLAAPAVAGGGHRHGRGPKAHVHARHGHHKHFKHVKAHRHHGHYRPHHARARGFVVPRHIRAHRVGRYAPYRWKRVYFPAHRHHHEVYRFPVLLGARVVLAPHAYCDGRLFGAARWGYHRHAHHDGGFYFGFEYRRH